MSASVPRIPFVDLEAQRRVLGDSVERAIGRVIEHGQFIMGPEVEQLESALTEFCGVAHAVTCSSGTDALLMPLMAWKVGRGDAVFVPSFTFAATAEVVALLGAVPIFVDVDGSTFNMDASSLERSVNEAARQGLRPLAVIPVDLFGLPADYTAIQHVARRHGLHVLADAAQSFGATTPDGMVGTLGDITATSFFPAKPLGAYGDGGAMFTNDPELAAVLRSLRFHGKGSDKYDNVRVGLNGRLDTMQAAILLEKLRVFPTELASRESTAARYSQGLAGAVHVPHTPPGLTSAWAQYTIQTEGRDAIAAGLAQQGIPTAIYYPLPLHRQTAYRDFPSDPEGLPVAERLANEVLSLPMHPYLDLSTQNRIVNALHSSVGRSSYLVRRPGTG